MMKIAVTGASGFVGEHLIKKLLSKNFHLRIFVRKKPLLFNKDIEVVEGDLVTGEGLPEFLSGTDAVIHLAARVTSPEDKMFDDNVIATHNLVTQAINSSVSQFIFVSSVAVYGTDKKTKFREGDECSPDTPYGVTKYLAELLVRYWSKKTGNLATILRPFNVYGPGNRKGIIYTFCSDIRNDHKVVVYGDGKQERDFLYIDDFIDAIIEVLEGRREGIYNLGSPRKYAILDVVSTFKQVVGDSFQVEFSPSEQGKVFDINQDLSKVRKELGWQAKVSLEEGIKRTIKWYDDQKE